MASERMSAWLAPWLGFVVAGVIGIYVAYYEMEFDSPSTAFWFVVGSAVIGFGGGCILWLRDRSPK